MEDSNFITLLDENDKEVVFDLVMSFEYEGKRYVALLPVDSVQNVADDEVVILEIIKENGTEKYVPIQNPILLDEVFNEFLDLFDEQFDDDEEEGEQYQDK